MHDTGEVDLLCMGIDAAMDGVDKAMVTCGAISATDQAAWGAFYGGWRTLSIYWHTLRQDTGIINSMQGLFDVEGLIGTSIYDQMTSYNKDLPTWQAKVAAACPGTYTAPPPVTLPDATKAPSTDWAGLTQKALIAAIAISTGLVLYKGLQIVEDVTSNARKA